MHEESGAGQDGEAMRQAVPSKSGFGRRQWPILAALLALALVAGGAFFAAGFGLRLSRNALPVVRIADVGSERLTTSGPVVGFAAEHGSQAWLGIPYARAPVDALRWRAPRPPEAWVDTLDALSLGSPCMQLGSPLGGVPAEDDEGFAGSEDCLFLNVWAPRVDGEDPLTDRSGLPVMVWIHGGGNRVGQGGGAMYDGARLAGGQDVVVVSFNYRLGPFGWLSHPALRSAATDAFEASGNFGTLDQIRALEWVQANIDEFGGDSDNVTVFGESAGGTNVLALLLARPAAGLFHRAIAQSGSTASVSRAEAENPLDGDPPGQRHSAAEIAVSLLVRSGLVPDGEAARGYAEALAAEDFADLLRGFPARSILDAYRSPENADRIEVPRLVRDGALLPENDWLEAYGAGRFHAVPLLLGSNRDEMKLFLSQDPQHVRRYLGVVYRIHDSARYAQLARAESDRWRQRAVDRPAAAIVASGRAPVYGYRFDWDEEPRWLGTDLSFLLGAAHGFELPFLFGTFDLGSPFFNRLIFPEPTRATRKQLASRMQAYWAEFARTGRPGRGGREDLPEWPAWKRDASGRVPVMLLDSENDGGVRIVRLETSSSQRLEPGGSSEGSGR